MNKTKCLALLLVFALLLPLAGCAAPVQAADLMSGIQAKPVQVSPELPDAGLPLTGFSVSLLQAELQEEGNTLLAPLSLAFALGMTGNGARSGTRTQMEKVLGLSVEELNAVLSACRSGLEAEEKTQLQLANSIWFSNHDRFTVNQSFLQTNADFYGADLYSVPFTSETLREINSWVKEKTEGKIPKILDTLPEDTVMCLINALSFEGQWLQPYLDSQIRKDTFLCAGGKKTTVDFLHSRENVYLKDENATGFMKAYAGGRYAFAALLPREGISLEEYILSLDGEKLHSLLTAPEYTDVDVSIPKFEAEYSADLVAALKDMGMTDAFDPFLADLSGLGNSILGNISIDKIAHKTYLSLDAQGTKAGAATAITATDARAAAQEPVKTVHLDRPFLYMVLDRETGFPVFIGTLQDI